MIIAINGFQGSGKDTIGFILTRCFGFKKLSFACVLKDVLATLFGWPRDLLEGTTKESREWREQVDEWWAQKLGIPHFTPRWALQNIGTDIMRDKFHPDIWTLAVERRLEMYTNYVITDCRFPNEVSMLKRNGAKFIHVFRGPNPEWFNDYKNGLIDTVPLHKSEYMWIRNHFDHEITNDGSIEELEIKVKNIIKEINL